MRASTVREERDPTSSTTARLVFALLAGNVLATVAVAAFRPFSGQFGFLEEGSHMDMVLTTGTLSLVASGLLFMLWALRRRQPAWWTVVTAVNLAQVGRLVPALIAITMWPDDGGLAGVLWVFLAVPLFSVLASLGIVVTVREMRRSKRRRHRTLLV